MSFKLFALVLLAVVASAAATECSGRPNCRWQCDDPQCPAICHPVCERPKCEMKCEEVSCAKCTVHCQRPQCTIRCPKEQCEKEGCPKCETVCAPAQCHTTCTAPEPKCSPVCEELACTNKCAKPTNCAKPKCELQCEAPACQEYQATSCCACNVAGTQAAIAAAPAQVAAKPSFLEVFHTFQHREQVTGQAECCPCKH